MKKPILYFTFFCYLFNFSQNQRTDNFQNEIQHNQNDAQEFSYKKISISNPTEDIIQQLQFLGIDLTCGAILKDNKLSLELFDYELEILNNQGIKFNIIIDDLTKFYSERAVKDLPLARLNIEQKKITSSLKTYSVNEILNNVGQYNDCDEIDWTVPINWNLNPNSSPNSFGGCLTLTQVLQELDDMRALYPNLISVKTDTSPTSQTTSEGRTIYYVRISDNPDLDESGEPETLYQSLIHSREASTVMNQLYFMWYLLENYSSDDAIKNLVNNQALYFIPVYNPDGFVQNEIIAPDGGGGQRKNRNVSAGSCGNYTYGIDLNRNSAYYWGNGGSSTDPCNQTYMGTAPFSEPETQIMRDFFLLHDFELALNHHSYKNAMLHAYAGTTITNPRPDEYSKYNHDMTYYNRYAHGPSTSISALNSGNMNDWMLGGPAGISANGTPTGTGSGKQTLAWTPENGLSSEGSGGSYGGFWPTPSNYLPIAKRAMRVNLLAAYFSGKYAKLHDFNQSDINSLSGNLNFAIENLGQTSSDYTLTVTPVSANLLSVGSPSIQSGMTVLQQNSVSISYTLDPSIQVDDEIEYKVVLTNDYASDNVLYEANIKKRYMPSVLFNDNPDIDALNNWTTTGGNWFTTSDAYSGTTAITSNVSAPYAHNQTKYLQKNNSLDLSNITTTIIQFYAKWDLERSFDYVQLEGSTNGTSWTALCGKLTKPAAPNSNNTYSGKSSSDNNFQPDGELLYDGDTQDKWNMEEIVIDVSNNSFLFTQNTVYFRFTFKSDSSNRQDSYYNADFEGFSFDDFKITTIQPPCIASVPNNIVVSNISESSAIVSCDIVPSATYDYQYREIGAISWTQFNSSSNSENITGLNVGTDYEVQIRSVCSSGSSAYSSSINFTTTNTTLISGSYFETGLDGWTDGGNDCARVTGSFSYEGNYSIRLRDNSGTSSSMTSPTLDLSSFEDVEISFYFYPNSMENGEDFWLRYNDGTGWVTVATYASGTDFSNGSFYNKTITLSDAQYNLTSNAQFRIQCDASGNNDQIYVDEVIINASTSGPDTTVPVITLTGSSTIDLNVGGTYTEQGATATDNIDGDISGSIVIAGDLVDGNIVGTYVVTYNVNDAAGNNAVEVTRTVNVIPDTTVPVITLIGSSTVDLNLGGTYTEQGATAIDNIDGDISGSIVIAGDTVDGNSVGTYVVTYNVSDAAGNNAVEVIRTVNVAPDITAPVITLIGNPTIDLDVGGTYTEQGATATDNIDGDISGSIVIAGDTVDENTAGTYVITYNVSDVAGNNATEVIRTVNVNEVSSNPVILNQGYFESGLDGWTDGGSDCERRSTTLYSYEGQYSVRIRDNSGTASAMTLSNIDMTPYAEVEVDFYFYAKSMENNEDFWMRYYDGSSWNTIESYVQGSNINNNTFYNATIILPSAQYNLAVNSGIRFQCDASSNNDQIYVDQVTVTGYFTNSGNSNSLTSVSSARIETNTTEEIAFSDIKISPNPVRGDILNIHTIEEINFSYRIFDMTGKIITTGESNKEIHVGKLEGGMYFIEVYNQGNIITKKFIKQ